MSDNSQTLQDALDAHLRALEQARAIIAERDATIAALTCRARNRLLAVRVKGLVDAVALMEQQDERLQGEIPAKTFTEVYRAARKLRAITGEAS